MSQITFTAQFNTTKEKTKTDFRYLEQ